MSNHSHHAGSDHANKRKRDDPHASKSDSGGPPTTGKQENTLFIGSLATSTTEYQLSQLVKPFGALVRLDYMFHLSGPNRGMPRGYAFVEYSNRDTAAAARQALDGMVVNGRALSVRFSTEKVVFTDGVGRVERPGAGPGRGKPLAIKKDREYRTLEETQALRAASSAGAIQGRLESAKATESVMDAKMTAIRERLEALRRGSSGSGGQPPSAVGAPAAVGGGGGGSSAGVVPGDIAPQPASQSSSGGGKR